MFRESQNRFHLKQACSFHFREWYVNVTFLFIGRVPNTFNFTKNVKFLYFKSFGTVQRSAESISIVTNILLLFSGKICKFNFSLYLTGSIAFGHVNIDHSPDWPRWYWPSFDWLPSRLTTVPIDYNNIDHLPDWPLTGLTTIVLTIVSIDHLPDWSFSQLIMYVDNNHTECNLIIVAINSIFCQFFVKWYIDIELIFTVSKHSSHSSVLMC